MSRLPNVDTGNPKVDYAFRLVDEQLSQLFALHGNPDSRNFIKSPGLDFQNNAAQGIAPGANRAYGNLISKGFARTGSDGTIAYAINLAPDIGATKCKIGTGLYRYRFLTPLASDTYVVVTSITTDGNAKTPIEMVSQDKSQFVIKTFDGTHTAADTAHHVLVFGDQAAATTGSSGSAAVASVGSLVPTTRRIDTTAPLMGGGDFSIDRTHSIDIPTLNLSIDRIVSPTTSVPLILSDDGTTVTLTYKMIAATGGFVFAPDLAGAKGGMFFQANNTGGAAGNGFEFRTLNNISSGGLFRVVDGFASQNIFTVNGPASSSVANNRPVFQILTQSGTVNPNYQDIFGAYQGGSAIGLMFSSSITQAAGIRILFRGLTPATGQAAGVAGIITTANYENTTASAQTKCAYGFAVQGGYSGTSVFGSAANDWIAGGIVGLGTTTNGNTVGTAGGLFVLRSGTAPTGITNWIGLGICTQPANTINACGIMCSESIETVADKPVIYNSAATFSNTTMPPTTTIRPYTAYTKGNTSHRWVAASSVLRAAISGTDTLDLSATSLFPTTNGLLSLGQTASGWKDLWLKDTAAAFQTQIQVTNTGILANNQLTLDLGNANRLVTLSGNPTLADWFDQNVKVAGTPQFARIGIGAAADATVLLSVNDAIAAPTLAGGAPTFTNYYGGNTNALGDPNAWLRVKVGANTYKIPLFT